MATNGDHFLVEPGKLRLADHDARSTAGFDDDKTAGRDALSKLGARLEELQETLYAEGKHRLLVVLQAPDAGGKDGTIRTVFSAVNPQGVKVTCFRQPTTAELAHDFLWRVHAHTPANGEIAIWNRSHYEDVLVARVNELCAKKVWRSRYEHIVAFERMLSDEGTTIRKFFLNISKDEQRQRLQARIDDPRKRWKWSSADLAARARWDDYQAAYEDALAATSTKQAPWYVVPADRNWFRDLTISQILVDTLEGLDMQMPPGEAGVENVRIP